MLEHIILAAALQHPIFTTEFDAPNAITAFDVVSRSRLFSIAPDPADPSNTALRIDVTQGGHYGGSLHVRLQHRMPEEPTRLYFRYRLWFDESWTTTSTGKLPGFGGTYQTAGWGGKPSDGSNGWSARGMFGGIDENGRIPIGSYIYHADMVEQGQTYGNSERWDTTLQTGRWYTIEQEIQLDTVTEGAGQADGWLKAWVDGVLVFDRQDLHVRDTDNLRIESVWLNIYHGGKTPSPSDMHLLIDDLLVAPTRPSQAPGP